MANASYGPAMIAPIRTIQAMALDSRGSKGNQRGQNCAAARTIAAVAPIWGWTSPLCRKSLQSIESSCSNLDFASRLTYVNRCWIVEPNLSSKFDTLGPPWVVYPSADAVTLPVTARSQAGPPLSTPDPRDRCLGSKARSSAWCCAVAEDSRCPGSSNCPGESRPPL